MLTKIIAFFRREEALAQAEFTKANALAACVAARVKNGISNEVGLLRDDVQSVESAVTKAILPEIAALKADIARLRAAVAKIKPAKK